MHAPPPDSIPAAPRGFRVAPAFVLFFLSPFVAEYLLGDFCLDYLGLMLVMAPMYGGGALAIREISRRLGKGWPTMLILALAYGLLEEGIVIQTLFNPHYLGLHLLAAGWVPSLGIGVWWTSFVLTLHVVWSISTPIALTEGMFAERRATPWLGKTGLAVALVLLAAGALLNGRFQWHHDPFRASVRQLATVVVLIVALILIAVGRRDTKPATESPAPSPWHVGAVALALGLLFLTLNRVLRGWPLAGVQALLDVAAVVGFAAWSRLTRWTPTQTLAAAGGALLTYAVNDFGQKPVRGGAGHIPLISHMVFAAIAVMLLAVAVNSRRKVAALAG